MTQTKEVEKVTTDDGTGTDDPVMHIVRRDGQGKIIYPMIALCGYRCRESLGGALPGWKICKPCEEQAVKECGAAPTR